MEKTDPESKAKSAAAMSESLLSPLPAEGVAIEEAAEFHEETAASAETEAEIQRIRSATSLPVLPRLAVPDPQELACLATAQAIDIVQGYIEALEYNYSGKPFLPLKRSPKYSYVITKAQALINLALPIQCVEAVFIASLLTSQMRQVERVPISFKSCFNGNIHRHIVLAIRTAEVDLEGANGRGVAGGGVASGGSRSKIATNIPALPQGRPQRYKWGALGLSRRSNLMNKPLEFSSLSALIRHFEECYEQVFHRLLTIYIGRAIPHGLQLSQSVDWRACKIRMYRKAADEVDDTIDYFAKTFID